MNTILKLTGICLLAFALAFAACKKKENPPSPSNSFDRTGMLTNMANNIIVPAYQALSKSSGQLDSMVTVFNASPNTTALLGLQSTFKSAYMAWQSCSEFQFGPADQQQLSENMNTFPADTTQIGLNIKSGNYNLAAIVNLDAKGFPGMDFLLFGTGADNNAIVAAYTTGSSAPGRKQYLAALSADIKTEVNVVLSAWQASYTTTFINATGTDVGGSISLLTNSMDYDLEILKNDKLGVPLGKQSMGTVFPAKTEAYYSGISSQLALLQLKAIQNIYLGESNMNNGLGFDDYLVSINAQYNNGSLNDAIKSEFTTAVTKLQAVPDPLSSTIQTNPSAVNDVYTEAEKLVVLLKTDMPSAMGVLITYNDTDGD